MKYSFYTDGKREVSSHSFNASYLMQITSSVREGFIVSMHQKNSNGVWDQVKTETIEDLNDRRGIIKKFFGIK